jgi:glutamate/tyrosine decarboxylase-like PLP-dependent enzyme
VAAEAQGRRKEHPRARVSNPRLPNKGGCLCFHRPNIILGANAQVALEKFARYFDVECRLVPVTVASKYRLDPKRAMEHVDENTIGIFVILGSKSEHALLCVFDMNTLSGTYTGHYEPVEEMAELLDEYEARTGHFVPIHGWFAFTYHPSCRLIFCHF